MGATPDLPPFTQMEYGTITLENKTTQNGEEGNILHQYYVHGQALKTAQGGPDTWGGASKGDCDKAQWECG